MEHRIEQVLNCVGLLPRLKGLLGHKEPTIIKSVLDVLTNMASGSEALKEKLLSAGVMLLVSKLFRHPDEEIMKKTVSVFAPIRLIICHETIASLLNYLIEENSECQQAANRLSKMTEGIIRIDFK